MTDQPPCCFLEWDSAFFGVRVARVQDTRLTPATTLAIVEWCSAHAIDLLYFLADADDLATMRLAEDNCFRLVDLRVTLDRPLDGALRPPAYPVRVAEPADLPILRETARSSFHQSRFYADPHIPAGRADALYEIWVEKRVNEPTSHVLVVDADGEAAGFITCLRDGTQGEIDLIGVSERARGRGVGRALVNGALAWFAEQGAQRASVVTQGRNIAAQRLYQHCGFATSAVQLWYHRWFGHDRPAASLPG